MRLSEKKPVISGTSTCTGQSILGHALTLITGHGVYILTPEEHYLLLSKAVMGSGITPRLMLESEKTPARTCLIRLFLGPVIKATRGGSIIDFSAHFNKAVLLSYIVLILKY